MPLVRATIAVTLLLMAGCHNKFSVPVSSPFPIPVQLAPQNVRRIMPTVLAEHHVQFGGRVGEENNAIHIRPLLEPDSLWRYHIDGPLFRDRVRGRQASDLPPIIVTSKLIRVESGEVLYHRVMVAPMNGSPPPLQLTKSVFQRLGRDTLERGMAQTGAELKRALG
jgi:hypothetical protein